MKQDQSTRTLVNNVRAGAFICLPEKLIIFRLTDNSSNNLGLEYFEPHLLRLRRDEVLAVGRHDDVRNVAYKKQRKKIITTFIADLILSNFSWRKSKSPAIHFSTKPTQLFNQSNLTTSFGTL